jgi:hypothetical protein
MSILHIPRVIGDESYSELLGDGSSTENGGGLESQHRLLTLDWASAFFDHS